MRVGLFFGSFNPIHVGHLIIANYMAEHTNLDKLWLVVSPQNPLKPKDTLLSDHHRIRLVREAIADNPKLHASNVEFDLPKPSYTVETIAFLKESYPDNEFVLIMGEDNLQTLDKWKNYKVLIEECEILVYPRVDNVSKTINDEIINQALSKGRIKRLSELPIMNISASFIRKSIAQGKDVRYLLTEPVWKYIEEMNFYRG